MKKTRFGIQKRCFFTMRRGTLAKIKLGILKTLKPVWKNVFSSPVSLTYKNPPHMGYFVLTQTKSDVFSISLNVTPIARLVWLLVEKCEKF